MIGGKEDSYIKIKDIEQNSKGDQFIAAYLDDGVFKLRIFGKQQRSVQEAEAEELNINKRL